MPTSVRARQPALVARPRCAILARVSTDEQHLDVQRDALLEEAARRGLDVVAVLEDVGSGRRMDEREGLRSVLDLADARAIDVLLVAELSRVGRSLAGVAAVVDRLSARGVALVSIRESFDITSPVGRLLVGVLSAVAQFEVEILAQRTAAGVRAAAARGAAIGQAPYGTAWGPPTGPDGARVLVAVPAEMETLRRALSLRGSLGRWDLAAAALTAEGRVTRTGRAWRPSGLSAACRNPRVRRLLEGTAAA